MTTSAFKAILAVLSSEDLSPEEKANNILLATANWIKESPLDVYTEDRMVIVNAIIDEAYQKNKINPDCIIQDLLDDLSAWIDYVSSPSNNFHGELDDQIKESKYTLSKARWYLSQQQD
jgi:hypothetical protein